MEAWQQIKMVPGCITVALYLTGSFFCFFLVCCGGYWEFILNLFTAIRTVKVTMTTPKHVISVGRFQRRHWVRARVRGPFAFDCVKRKQVIEPRKEYHKVRHWLDCTDFLFWEMWVVSVGFGQQRLCPTYYFNLFDLFNFKLKGLVCLNKVRMFHMFCEESPGLTPLR